MKPTVLFGAVMVALATACAAPGELVGEDPDYIYVREDDMVVPVPRHDQPRLIARTGPAAQVVFLEFGGGAIHPGGWSPDNAQTSTSFIVAGEVTVPAFEAGPWGDRAQAIAAVVDGLRSDLAGYQVTVTTTRPASGPYTMVMVGGRPESIGLAAGPGGIAPLDVGNANPSDVAFVFSDVMAEFGYSRRELAWTIAHELGHTVGLRHIAPANDIMHPVACHCAQAWGEGPVVGREGEVQRDRAVLDAVFLTSGDAPATFGTGDFTGGGADLYCHDPAIAGSPGRTTVARADGARFTDGGIFLSGWCGHAGATFGVGDFDGDGLDDVYCHDPIPQASARTWVATSTGSELVGRGVWLSGWCGHAGARLDVGDLDGDGKDDLTCHDAAGTTWVATSTGDGFVDRGVWLSGWCGHAGATFGVGDFDGDGKDDVWCHDPIPSTDTRTWVAGSTGERLVGRGIWLTGWCGHPGASFGTTSTDGDDRDDVYCHDTAGTTWIASSTGTAFAGGGIWLRDWCGHPGATFGLDDFDGDGRDDAWCHDPIPSGDARTWVATSTGGGFADRGVWLAGWCGHTL